ncbi:hypothetical protein K438DRAFT_413206 [Mycena galopus ATCC 62051]|nr:hypothetical protein K438DRAFT_413206 [Mycena galopus ATCC 62051]
MRIRISFRVRLEPGLRFQIASISCALAPFRNARASRHATTSLPPACTGLLQPYDTKRDALVTVKPLPPAQSTLHVAADAVPRPHPQHQVPTHARYDTQQTLLFLGRASRSLIPGAPTIFSGITTVVFSAPPAHQAGCKHHRRAQRLLRPFSRHTPFSSPPTATTISGAAPLSPRRLPLSRAPTTICTTTGAQRSRGCSSLPDCALFCRALRGLMRAPPLPQATFAAGAPYTPDALACAD